MLVRGMNGFLSAVTGAVGGALKTVGTVAVKSVTLPYELQMSAARSILSTAAPAISQASSLAAQGIRIAGQAAAPVVGAAAHTAEGLLISAGQGVASAKGTNVAPAPSNLPLILGGVAAAGILAVVLLRRRAP